MGSKILERVAPGIYRTISGYRVKVSVGSREQGGLSDEVAFPADALLREMKDWQIQKRAELKRATLRPVRGTLGADIPRYMKAMKAKLKFSDSREDEINAWVPQFGHRRRHTITTSEIDEQVTCWEAESVAASTIRHRLSALSMLYRKLDGETAYNPVRGAKRPAEPQPKGGGPSIALVNKVLDALIGRVVKNNRGWVTLARVRLIALTGMRHSQVMRLTPDDFMLDDDNPYIVVADAGKNGEPHIKPLGEEGLDAARLFLRIGCFGQFSQSSVYKSWKRACADANVPFFNPYKLRHAYGTALRGKMDLADVQQVLGHKNIKTTMRYAGIASEKVAAAAGVIDNAWKRARGQRAWDAPQVTEKKTASDK